MHIAKKKEKFKSKKFKKKKNYQVSSENSDSSSSDEEEATEHANICYMTLEENEVQYTKLLDAFHKLYNNLKNEKIKNKVLTKENENLFKENSCYASQISSINSQKDDFEKVISSLKKR